MPNVALTLERMRGDVAAMLSEDASQIGDEDNLIDLGLDSMRAMKLLVLWRDATGLSLAFSELAEHVTLAGWWAVVRSRQARAGA